MSKRRILIQLDTDRHASAFDRVVAIDTGVDEIFSYAGVEAEDVEGLVHGAMFTRGVGDLKSTAIFIGGRNVARCEEILAIVQRTFFGPLRCSVLMDGNGANTTAAAAVAAAGQHIDFAHSKVLILGGTGPVGRRAGSLMAGQGAAVWLGSRSKDRAADVCESILAKHPGTRVFPVAITESESIGRQPERFHFVLAAGAAGARLVQRDQLKAHSDLKVLIDLNAVPPSGIEGVEPNDKGREANGVFHYGALGIGALKMKIHRAAIVRLFETNDLVLDSEQVYQIALRLQSAQ